MKAYTVRVFVPSVYEIEAADPDEARRKAVARYKEEHKTWIEPEVQLGTGGWEVYAGDPDGQEDDARS